VLALAIALSLVVLRFAYSVGWLAFADGAWYMPHLHRAYSIAGAVLVAKYWFIHPRSMEGITPKNDFPTSVEQSKALAAASLLTSLSCFGLLCITTAARLQGDNGGVSKKLGRLRLVLVLAWVLVAALFIIAAVEGGRLLSSGEECDGKKKHDLPPLIVALVRLTLDVKMVALIDTVPLLRRHRHS
jgi:hypothetical protein